MAGSGKYFELSEFLARSISVFDIGGNVRDIVVGDKVDLVVIEELLVDDPRGGIDDFIDPLAVLNTIRSLLTIENRGAFKALHVLLVTDTHDQVGVGEELFALFELTCVSIMEEVVNAIGIDPYNFILIH